MKRRDFLESSLTLAAAMGVGVYGMPTFAQSASNKKMIYIFLRGGADALSLLPPKVNAQGQNNYSNHPLAAFRGANVNMARNFLFNTKVNNVDTPKALAIGNHPVLFHPQFQEMRSLINSQNFGIIYHVGATDPTRSHFTQMDYIESGARNQILSTGFLARAAAVVSGRGRLSVALGPRVPRSLRGSDAPLINDLNDLRSDFITRNSGVVVNGNSLNRTERLEFFKVAEGAECQSKICRTVASAQDTYDRLESHIGAADIKEKNNNFVQQCELAAALVRSPFNPPFITIDFPGWDTHQDEHPTNPNSRFSQLVAMLSKGLVTLRQKMGNQWSNTVVVVMSEFGRTLVANPAMGTDHGRGGFVFVMGGSVQRSRFTNVGNGWNLNSLEGNSHNNRALKVNIDIREVLAEVIHRHMGVGPTVQVPVSLNDNDIRNINNTRTEAVFPGLSSYPRRNLV